MKKLGAIDLLEKGVTSTAGGSEKVSPAEQTRIRRQRARQQYRASDDEEALKKLQDCTDIIADWQDDKTWWREFFEVFAPPPLLSIDQWADRWRQIPKEFSAEPGQWRTHRVPYMREPMRACSASHGCRRVIVIKPTQSGGTEACLINTILFTIDVAPRSMLVVFPTLDLTQSFSRERLEPALNLMPRVREKVHDVTVGADAQTRSSIKRKVFAGGFAIFCGANSTAGLSSRPIPLCLCDEVDECIRQAGSAGNPMKLLSARSSTFPDRKEIYVSSPINQPEESGILSMWEDSSKGTLQTSCPDPECGAWQVLDFDRMSIDDATLSCVECGRAFNQHEWNSRGESAIRWHHANPGHETTMGFRLSALNSPWINWKTDLCEEFKEARRIAESGDDSQLRVFYNTKLCQPYRVLGRQVKIDLYNDRREPYECHQVGAEIPTGVLTITCAIDVQDDRLVYELVGWGAQRESWGIEYGEIGGDPHVLPDPKNPGASVWEIVDKLTYQRVLRYTDGKLAKVRMIFVDSGGHCTNEAYSFTKARPGRVWAIKGYGGPGKAFIIGGRVRERNAQVWFLRLGVDALKEEFHARLQVAAPGGGFCHWPRGESGEDACGYTPEYFRALLAERRVLKYTSGGFAKLAWHKARTDRNDSFDVRIYSRGALEHCKVRLELMGRDIARLSPEAVQEVEVEPNRTILIDTSKRTGREYQLQPPTARTSAVTTAMSGHPWQQSLQEQESTIQWTGSAASPPKKPSTKYGAFGQSF